MKKTLPTILLLCIISLSFSSCRLFVYKVAYKAKFFPHYFSEKKITKFYNKHSNLEDQFILLTDSSLVNKIKEPGWAFDAWELFDSDGNRLRRKRDSVSCIVSDFEFFEFYNIENTYIDTSYSKSSEHHPFNLIRQMTSNDEKLLKPVDYALVLYWSAWRGKYSGDILGLGEEFVLNNTELSVRIIPVNMDFREEMKETWVDRATLFLDEQKSRQK